MCEGCPIQTIAELYPKATTELRIWNEGDGKPSQVFLSVVRQGERFAVHDQTCRGAVKQMCREMDAKKIGSCRVVIEYDPVLTGPVALDLTE